MAGGNKDKNASIGIKIKEARKASGLSQGEVASIIGVAQSIFARWEKGTTVPAFALPAIAKATNHPIEYFLLEDHELSESKIKSASEVAALLGAEIETKNNEIESLKKKVEEMSAVFERFGHLDVPRELHDLLEFTQDLFPNVKKKTIEELYLVGKEIIKKNIKEYRDVYGDTEITEELQEQAKKKA